MRCATLAVLTLLTCLWSADPVLEAVAGRHGLCLHLGAGDGSRTVAIARASPLVVHAMAAEAAMADAAVRAADLDGRVQVEAWNDPRLPFPDRVAAVVVAETGCNVPEAEILRVLSPTGIALLADGAGWRRLSGLPMPGADDWTHQRHGADGNPVSTDTLIAGSPAAPPDRLRWIGDIAEMWPESVRLAGGRMFLFDKRPKGSSMAWVGARDAWSGVLLWEATFPGVASGAAPGRVRSRPVATADRLYLFRERLIAVDARDGREIAAVPLVPLDVVAPADGAAGVILARTAESLVCLDASSLAERWRVAMPEDAAAMTKDRKGFAPAERLPGMVATRDRAFAVTQVPGTPPRARAVGLNLATGAEAWSSDGTDLGSVAWPVLVADGVLVVATADAWVGLPISGAGAAWRLPVRAWRTDRKTKERTLKKVDLPDSALTCALADGGALWLREDLDRVYGEADPPASPPTTLGWIGIDLASGRVLRRVGYPTERPWGGIDPGGQLVATLTGPVGRNWAGRCYDDIGVAGSILSQTMEIVGLAGQEPRHLRGVRGHCGIGFLVGAHAVMTPPNQCIGCYPMVRGSLAYEPPPAQPLTIPDAQRLLRGPAFAGDHDSPLPAADPARDWPIYRHDPLRTGCTAMAVETDGLSEAWTAAGSGRATQAVAARGVVVVASIERGRLTALDAATGARRWQVGLPARIDTAPTLVGDRVVVGCHDGRIYAVDLHDGRLAWRFDAAPELRRIVAGEQIESPWPVLGSVLVHDGAIHAMAGHLSSLGGGLHRWGLDPATGAVRYHQVFAGLHDAQSVILPTHWYKQEDHALNNLLLGGSVDGKSVVRLYDQWGGWDFAPDDGRLVRLHGAVPQPGWPKNRMSPGAVGDADRWPWVGHDRVTAAALLRGLPITHASTLETDPRTRFSGNRGNFFIFPRAGATGALLTVKDGATTVDPEPWLIPTDPAVIGDPKIFAKDPARIAADTWAPRQFPLTAAAAMITGERILWLAGAVPTTPQPGASATAAASVAAPSQPMTSMLIAVDLTDGSDRGRWTFPGTVAFEGLSAADGRILVVQGDGTVRCFTARRR